MQIYLVAFVFHIALLYLSARIGDKRFGLALALISVLPFVWWRVLEIYPLEQILRHIL